MNSKQKLLSYDDIVALTAACLDSTDCQSWAYIVITLRQEEYMDLRMAKSAVQAALRQLADSNYPRAKELFARIRQV